MIPNLLKLNEDTVKEVQKVLDKYGIDFDYLKYLQKKQNILRQLENGIMVLKKQK